MTKRFHAKKQNNGLLFLLIIFVLLIGLFIIFWSLKRPFCANSQSCRDSLSLRIENGAEAFYNGNKIRVPEVADYNTDVGKNVLGQADFNGEKRIYIDLTTQTLKAYEDQNLVLNTFIASGKWYPTPTGEFKIWSKIRATRMSGGEGDEFYDLPNVPYVMFFEGENARAYSGFGLHGAYWHNNFGHPMSHGCVNMRQIDAEKLFNWAEVGTRITIYGQADI